MIDFGSGAALLRLVGGGFWLVVIGAFLAAALIPKTKKRKAIALASVIALLMLFPGRQVLEQRQEQSAAQSRLGEAERRFQEHCKTAGEFIHKTAENVDGVLLMKLRPEEMNSGDQYKMDDPYGDDLGGEGYIQTFVRGFETRQAQFAPGSPNRYGYLYVEAVDPQDGKRYRYTGSMKVVGRQDANAHNIQVDMSRNPNYDLNIYAFKLDRVPAPGPAPRYGVTYDDISTREDRDYWIAGSSLKVIDLSTNEVMAERIGYMMDRGQGNSSGGRSPWLLAADHACPSFFTNPNIPPNGHGSAAQRHQTEDFVEKILKPKLEKE